jgi:hypothetical protein
VLVDRKARGWIIASVVILIAAAAAYVPLMHNRPTGPSGGSVAGLVYGGVGSAFMLIAVLLGLRKRLRTLQKIGPFPAGRAHTWMQAHVWLGTLSYPIILFHGGFRFGQTGSLTWVIMWLFTIVFVSGIFGLIFQNIIPKTMLERLPLESIYEQHARILSLIRGQAKTLVEDATRKSEDEGFEFEAVPAGTAVATLPGSRLEAAKTQLRAFYENDVHQYLGDNPKGVPQLASQRSADSTFASVRASMPPQLLEVVNDLEHLVAERRQMAQQRVWYYWLHGWLLVHVPLSYALVILAIIHAVSAARYI